MATPVVRDYTFRVRGKLVTVRLERGQFVASLRYLSKRFGRKKTAIERFMATLCWIGEIARVENPFYLVRPPGKYALPTVYEIVDYDKLDAARAGTGFAIKPKVR